MANRGTPTYGGDHARDRVRQEVQDTVDAHPPSRSGVQQQGQNQSADQHDGHLHDSEQEDPSECDPERRAGECLGVVLEADEHLLRRPEPQTARLEGEQTLHDRVHDRRDVDEQEEHSERNDEKQDRPEEPIGRLRRRAGRMADPALRLVVRESVVMRYFDAVAVIPRCFMSFRVEV